jgi:cytochrome c oxidase subunit II
MSAAHADVPDASPRRAGAARRRALLATLTAVLALACTPVLAAQEVADRWGPTPSASRDGHLVDGLFWLITWLVGVSFAIVLVLLLIAVVRDRARPGHKASYDHGASLHDKRFTAITSVTVFIVLDAWVLVVTMTDLREKVWNFPKDDKGAYRVEVLAQQWAWNFRVPGADGAFGTPDDIVTLNDLTVPQDRPVIFNLTSKDVIHSLFLPDMRIKRDANPGAINQVWFQPAVAGTFDILCAELCGYAHYQMHGKLKVLPATEFAAWEQEAGAIAAAAYDSNDPEAQWAWAWKE